MIKFLELLKVMAPEAISLAYNFASPYDVATAINFDLTTVPGAYIVVENENIPNPVFLKWFNMLIRKRGGYFTYSPYLGWVASDNDSDETRYKMFLISLFQTYGDYYEDFNKRYKLNNTLINLIENANDDDLITDIAEHSTSSNFTHEIFPDNQRETESPSNKDVEKVVTTDKVKNNYLKLIQLIKDLPDFWEAFISKFFKFFSVTDLDD